MKLHFEGVYQRAEVYVNGQKAGQHGYGYTPFTIDVTPYINKNKKNGLKGENEVVVKVNNADQPNCRWYSGSGIYRHVWLQTMPTLHIAENGVFITTHEVTGDKATVVAEVAVENESDQQRNATIVIGSRQMMVNVPAHEKKLVSTSFSISSPRLWSPENPYLYTTEVLLREGGATIDSQQVRYGIRTF